VAGIVAATTVFNVIASTAGLSESGGPSTTVSWVKIVLGALLLPLARRQRRARPRSGEPVERPKWTAAIDKVTFGRQPRSGLPDGREPEEPADARGRGRHDAGDLGTGQAVVAVAGFTVIAASSVAIRSSARGPVGTRWGHGGDQKQARGAKSGGGRGGFWPQYSLFSQVVHTPPIWGQEVAGSNPASPTSSARVRMRH
jgi:hypothetical protein